MLEAQLGVHHLHQPLDFLKPSTNLMTSVTENGPLRAAKIPGLEGPAPLNTGRTREAIKRGHWNTHRQSLGECECFFEIKSPETGLRVNPRERQGSNRVEGQWVGSLFLWALHNSKKALAISGPEVSHVK